MKTTSITPINETRETIDLCGFPVSMHSLEEHTQIIREAALSSRGLWVLTLNLEMISRARRDLEYRELLHTTQLITADGMPIVWAARLKENRAVIKERTTGIDLVVNLLTSTSIPKFGIIGGEDPRRALEYLGVPHDRAYVFDGKVSFEHIWIEAIVSDLRAHETRLLFVALGAPKPDQLIKLLRPYLEDVVMIGVGGAFDMIGGIKPRAPKWMQNIGLEWLFRLSREPRRLWRRYLLLYPEGVLWLVSDVIRSRLSTLFRA